MDISNQAPFSEFQEQEASVPFAALKYDADPEAYPAASLRYRVVKRGLDIVLSLLIMPMLAPAFVTITLILLIDCPGPVFFSHRRIRTFDRYFGMWKFRTMVVDADSVLRNHIDKNSEALAEWTATHKLRRDPRITRFGAFLRRTSLDELPQIWNVLNGTMSFVGPRPIVDAEVPKYGDNFKYYTCMVPGITGLWQVSGRSSVSYKTRVILDRRYAQEWSLTKDFIIFGRTIIAVFRQDGAY